MTDETSSHTDGDVARPANAAAFGAVALFGFLILRIFAVSAYDWDTAFLVSTTLSLDDGLSLVFGSLMAGEVLTAVLLVFVAPLLMAGSLWAPRSHRIVLTLLAALSVVVAFALTVSSRFWWLPAAIAAVFGLLALTRRLKVKNRLRTVAATAMARIGWLATVAVLIVAAFVQTPWVPHEKIETMQGAVEGYVLSVDPGYLNVLTDENEFVIIPSNEVISRE